MGGTYHLVKYRSLGIGSFSALIYACSCGFVQAEALFFMLREDLGMDDC